jgi:CRISPR-associated protein Cmr4
MSAYLLGMLAETPLHPGVGQSVGVVDLPVAREGTTHIPQMPETGLKGALKQVAEEEWPAPAGHAQSENVRSLFGAGDGAGELVFSTGRLLLLPVRRLDGPYAWVTTPLLVERLRRDAARLLGTAPDCAIDNVNRGAIRAGWVDTNHGGGHAAAQPQTVFLEEFSFTASPLKGENSPDAKLIEVLKKLLCSSPAAARLARQLVIMNDEDFVWYAENALPVAARNQLSPEKTSQNLWYEETLPPDTLLYAGIARRTGPRSDPNAEARLSTFASTFRTHIHEKYFQIGGNETVGHGWVRATCVGTLS